MNAYATRVYEDIKAKYPWQTEFLQSVAEVFESLGPLLDKEPKYEANKILERMIIPERIIQFETSSDTILPSCMVIILRPNRRTSSSE